MSERALSRSELWDVAVVGAGPTGLSAAIELGLRGRRVLVLERSAMRGPQPRAKTLNMRSLLHFRRWGIAGEVRDASPVPDALPRDVIFQTRLYGHHITTLPNIHFRAPALPPDPRVCEPSEWIPQHMVEGVLRAKLAALPGIQIRYGCELTGLVQDDDGVRLLLAEDGEEIAVDAHWAIGADGARSAVRERIGAALVGRHAYACNYNLVLRIPELAANPPERLGLMHWMINADSPVVMGPIGDLWYFAQPLAPGVSMMTPEEIAASVTAAVGRPVAFEVVTVDPWYAHELIADHYRVGRVFLAGDACHLHPPFGGYGMNMGIGDAVDIAWKLDAVIAGWGGDELLESYEFERRRVAEWTIREAVENYRTLSRDLIRPGLEDDGPEGDALRARLADEIVAAKSREFHTIGLVLGYHYGGSPVIACDDTPPPPIADHYDPSVACGALAPHVELADGQSIYDLFGSGFTIVDTMGASGLASPLVAAAGRAGIPMTHVRIDEPSVIARYGRRLVLIRPDQHVAWFGDRVLPHQSDAIIAKVAGRYVDQAMPPVGDRAHASASEGAAS